MKKKLAIITLVLGLVVLAGSASVPFTYVPVYTILGAVQNADDGTSADGQYVYFYKEVADISVGKFSLGAVGASRYMINAFNLNLTALDVGQTYSVAIPNTNPDNPVEGYGAMPVSFTISGKGYDEAPLLVLEKGADPFPVAVTEPPPAIKLWFGNRLYQPELVAKGEPFIVASRPEIRVEVTIEDPYTLSSSIQDYSIFLDPNTANARDLALLASNITQKIYVAGTAPQEEKISALSLEYALGENEAMDEGEHAIAVTASSSGALGPAATATETALVTVMGGPARLIGVPLTFPSPFSKRKHGEVTIQYQLSTDIAVRIIFVDISAKRVKTMAFEAGTEGGSAGLNKVTWDGMTDYGLLAGNGIYVGTILAQEDERQLGSVKLTIVD